MEFRVALLQIAPFGTDQDRNLRKALHYCRNAKAASADLVVLPELWNIGGTRCPIDDAGKSSWIASAIDRRSVFFGSFIALAQQLSMNIAHISGTTPAKTTKYRLHNQQKRRGGPELFEGVYL